MALRDALLPEFEHEMANTRKTLERITDEKLDWRAHPKSWTIRELATHLANLPSWTGATLNQDSLDLNPPGGEVYRAPPAKSRQEVLELFDKNFAEARAAIAATEDDHFFKPWSLLSGGATIFTMPRIAVLRSFVINHNIHHRAQLGVYLRLNDIAVPAIYGPTADEGM
jgi:uncharacterized damage-inducible protein DinB